MIQNQRYINAIIIGHSSDDNKNVANNFLNNGADLIMSKPPDYNFFKLTLENLIQDH